MKAVPQIVSGIVQAFASLGGEMINAGANLLHGLWEGISGAASWLWEKVSGWASSLVSGIKDFFGIHSPSTVFAEIGGNMADGVGVGFTDNMGGVEGDMTAAMGGAGALTAAEAVNAVNNGIIANIEGLSGAVNAIVERVITGLTAPSTTFQSSRTGLRQEHSFRNGNGDRTDHAENPADRTKHYYRIHGATSKVRNRRNKHRQEHSARA